MSAGHDDPAGHDDHAAPAGLRFFAPGAGPAVFAARADVVFAPPTPAAQIRAQVEAFLHDLGDALALAGCELVGHIKGTLDAGAQGSLLFSLTSLDRDARVVDTLCADPVAALFTINVIVFGVAENALAGLVAQTWASRIPALTTWRR